MHNPITSQTTSRHQLAAGRENISSRQDAIPRIGTTGTHGQRNDRSAFGLILRMMSTAAQTTANANSVPMLVISRSASIGRGPAPTATNDPMRIVVFHGVRNFGWTLPKKLGGTIPSRAMARKTRGALSIMTRSTEGIPATPAVAMMASAQGSPTVLNATDTPAPVSIWSYFTMPVRTATTAI